MEIATQQPESHPTPLPLDASQLPGVAPVTPRDPSASGPADAASQLGGVYDATGARQAQLAASASEIDSAMHSGMSADGARRDHYQAAVLAGAAGDQVAVPQVPEQAQPGSTELYPSGNQPGH